MSESVFVYRLLRVGLADHLTAVVSLLKAVLYFMFFLMAVTIEISTSP